MFPILREVKLIEKKLKQLKSDKNLPFSDELAGRKGDHIELAEKARTVQTMPQSLMRARTLIAQILPHHTQ